MRNQWRSTQRRQNLVGRIRGLGSLQPQPPDVVVVRRAEDEAVHRALAGLRPADQDILTLSAWDELTGPEIALVLGISVNAFHQRLFRAKKRLAHRIEQDQPDLVPNLNVQEGSS